MQSEKEALIAIDVLLDPDATMLSKAEAANARLRENFPKGYALDALHAPHISVLQRHVRARDLESIYAAAQRVLETESLTALQLKTTGYYYLPFSEQGMPMGSAGIVIEPTQELLRLQQKVIDAVAPFSESGGTPAAYITAPENAPVLQQLIDYVDSYVPKRSGKNFNPHVTVGVGREEFLKQLKAEPFDVLYLQSRWCGGLPARRFRDGGEKVMELDPKALSGHARGESHAGTKAAEHQTKRDGRSAAVLE